MRKTLPLPLLLSARFRRHEQTLLIASALSIALLSMLYALTSTAATVFDRPAVLFVNASAIVLLAFVFVAVAWKGAVPALVCALGVVLMHNAIILGNAPRFEAAVKG